MRGWLAIGAAAAVVLALAIWVAWIKYEIHFARQNLGLPIPYTSSFAIRESFPDVSLARGGEITVVIDLPESGYPAVFHSCEFDAARWKPIELPAQAQAWKYLSDSPATCAAETVRGPTSKGSGQTIVAVQDRRLAIIYYWSE